MRTRIPVWGNGGIDRISFVGGPSCCPFAALLAYKVNCCLPPPVARRFKGYKASGSVRALLVCVRVCVCVEIASCKDELNE